MKLLELRTPASAKAVTHDPGPFGAAPRKRCVLSGVSCNGFFVAQFFSNRRDGRALAVASRGHSYYGKDAEIGERVAKLAPLHRTARGSDTPTDICEGSSLPGRAESVHLGICSEVKVNSKERVINDKGRAGPDFFLCESNLMLDYDVKKEKR